MAQALLLGRSTPDLDALIASTEAGRKVQGAPVPKTFRAVSSAVAANRGALEAGGVFPASFLDQTVARLRETTPSSQFLRSSRCPKPHP